MNRAFRLQGLLNLRQLQEEQAAGRLANAHADLHTVESSLRDRKKRLEQCEVPHSGTGQDMLKAAALRNGSHLLIAETQAKRAQAKRVVAARQVDWSGARQRAATLEKLEDRHKSEVFADELHKEQVVLDEIASHRGNPQATDGSSAGSSPATRTAQSDPGAGRPVGGQFL